tara:strand:+ start:353 stop:589 length:237 start_codon:yes stop_codon:yes gene_type:complete
MAQQFEVKDETGSLFKNKEKSKPTAPDLTGNCKIAGKEWRVAAWMNESKKGVKYYSLKFSEPMAGGETSAPKEDDLPF